VRGLRGCLDRIAPRRAKLLILRYGIGGLKRRPGREVARILDLSIREYVRMRRRALRTLVIESRRSDCENATEGSVMVAMVAAGTAAAPFAGLASDTPDRDSRRRDESAVLGESASSPPDMTAPPGTASLPPSAVVDGDGFPALLAALLAMALASLAWFLLVRPALAAAARRRAYHRYFSGKER
jgi:hypothetical protein